MPIVRGVKVWRPLSVLQKTSTVTKNLALVILNRPLEPLLKELNNLWEKGVYRVAVDGGASRLSSLNEGRYVPDLVTGDFDSCPTETLNNLKQKGVEIAHTEDQNYTDFTKCLKVIMEKVNTTEEIEAVVCLGAFGGRLDQVMANLNTLFESRTTLTKPVYLVSDESLACLLQPGSHSIDVSTGLEGEWCGLIPIGCQCTDVTTTGLKWNLTHNSLQFGELISTSNTYDGSGKVTISTSHPILWTMGYQLPSSQNS